MSARLDTLLDRERLDSCAANDHLAPARFAPSLAHRRTVVEIAAEMRNHAPVIGNCSDAGGMLTVWADALLQPPRMTPVEEIAMEIKRQVGFDAESAVVILQAMTAALTKCNGHLALHKHITKELDVVCDWVNDELAELANQNGVTA